MISKNEIKHYSSLLQKKFRDEEKKFIVEGTKTVLEGLNSNYECEIVITTQLFASDNPDLIFGIESKGVRVEQAKNLDFSRLTDTITSQGIVAVFRNPATSIEQNTVTSSLIAILENISDPGNVGTIIRNCDWFGINNLIILKECADVFNPKTIRSSMGSIFHINIFAETEFESVKLLKNAGYKIVTADLAGIEVYNFSRDGKTAIVFANESHGPSDNLLKISDTAITIPRKGNAESLNVASASAVILSYLTR